MINSVTKLVLMIGLLNLSSVALAETPSQDAAGGDRQSEAASTAVEYCTTGKCFNHVNDVSLTENRYNEMLKITGTLDDRKDLPQYNFGKGTK